MNTSTHRYIVETLRTDFSVRQISEVLGINKSTFYYQPKNNPSEAVLREEIERLAARYPTYGYRRITKLLIRIGYTVGYRRVARLMKADNLSASVKRLCQTTTLSEGMHPWGNRLKAFEVCRCDPVWVGDITYVHLKAPFVYVSLLMDVCTRKIRGWQVSQHLTQPLTFRPLEQALRQSGFPEIHHSDQGVQYLSKKQNRYYPRDTIDTIQPKPFSTLRKFTKSSQKDHIPQFKKTLDFSELLSSYIFRTFFSLHTRLRGSRQGQITFKSNYLLYPVASQNSVNSQKNSTANRFELS